MAVYDRVGVWEEGAKPAAVETIKTPLAFADAGASTSCFAMSIHGRNLGSGLGPARRSAAAATPTCYLVPHHQRVCDDDGLCR
jgi:hypothetical protein